jgi:glycosyltransferase involved in cell wall biosynthesis
MNSASTLPGYSIVIATRNRLKALRLSIPRMLAQTCPPKQLIIVDSSDDHPSIKKAVREVAGAKPIPLIIIQSERGSSLQRNVGLALVDQPIIFFPDDDAIWFPGVAESIVTVYHHDTEHAISAVCAVESTTPPDDFPLKKAGYKMSHSERLKQRLALLRAKIEDRFVPDPTRVLGHSFLGSVVLPSWLEAKNVVPVETMTGFRMTFRSAVIRQFGFDTNLRRYSLYEDRDASLGAWRTGAVVAAKQAQVFHYKSPERRDDGYRMGVARLLNLAYVIAKHSPIGHPCRAGTLRFCRYTTFLYRVSTRDSNGRERYRGAKAALAEIPAFCTVIPELAAKCYLNALDRCLPADSAR